MTRDDTLPASRTEAGKKPDGRGGRRSTSFKPGQSGNPSGRAKKTEQMLRIEDLARSHSEGAIEALISIAKHGDSETARVSAANSILDRGWGKPVDRQETGKPNEFGDRALEEKELRERIKERSVKLGLAKVVPIGKRAE